MINFKNLMIKLYLMLLIVIIVGVVALYVTSDTTLKNEKREIINIEKVHVYNFAVNIEKRLKKLIPNDIILSLRHNKPLREHINALLSLFSNDQYRYVYLIYLGKKGSYRYLADGSKDINERGEFNQKFNPLSPIWSKAIKYQKPQYTIQKNIKDLWITYLYPITKYKNNKIILAFDISMHEYKTLMHIVRPIHKLLIVISIILFMVLLFIFFQTYIYFKQRKKSNIDILTHLYNRNYLEEIRKDLDLNKCAIAIADIDHFKRINDTYGHEVGDIVLESVSKRLISATRTFDTIIRYGGEEFLIIFNRQINSKIIKDISQRILNTISEQPIRVKDRNIQVTISMGVNPTPYKNRTLDDAIASADKMLYAAKTGGRNRVVILNEKIDTKHILLLQEITSAIEEKRLQAFFQPILDIKSGKITKYEALSRIIDKDGKIFSPAQFLPMIKRTNSYRLLTKIMLTEAFKIIKTHDVSVSVNFDIGDFFDDTIFEMVTDMLKENLQYSSMLTIEILEDMSISDIDKFVKRINILKQLNIKIAIDDFGSGYSSFNYLLNIKPDILKIDGSIISKISTDENARTILKSIVSICKSLEICTIAEFVENKKVLRMLQFYQVDMAQGFFVGKPLNLHTRKTIPRFLFFDSALLRAG